MSFPDSEIAMAVSKKFANNLWYLSEDLAGLAPSDKSIAVDTKREIIAALKDEGQNNPQPRARVDLAATEAISTKTVADFVTSASGKIVDAFKVSMDFLHKDPVEWVNDASFQSSKQVLCRIAAINDFAERGVALIQDYNEVLTKDEQQRQYLLQAVEWHRHHFLDTKKQLSISVNES